MGAAKALNKCWNKTSARQLQRDHVLRACLLEYYIESATKPELVEWSRDIGLDERGTIPELKSRIRAHTEYLTMPEHDFPKQTESYLSRFSADHLDGICQALGLPAGGNKDDLFRRIMREVHYQEGWLDRWSDAGTNSIEASTVSPFLERMPLNSKVKYEKDLYPAIRSELEEVFSEIYHQLPVAQGSVLRIDFHVGQPTGGGVGIEVKVPANNSDVQRALGQIDQYQHRYGSSLVVFMLTDFIRPESEHFLVAHLTQKGVCCVTRRLDSL